MTDVCEIVESMAVATSSCPVVSVAAMVYEAGAAASSVALGLTLGALSTAAGTSSVVPDHYALLASSASATSAVSTATVLTTVEESSAEARSSMVVSMPFVLASTGAAGSSVAIDIPAPTLTSVGIATSSASPSLVVARTLSSTAVASSQMTVYPTESVSSFAAGTSSVAHVLVATTTVTSTAAASATPFVSLVPNLEVLEAIGVATSSVSARTDWTVVAENESVASSSVSYKDPGRIAWVMNTESTAMSWYSNFDVESIAQVSGTTFAVGPEGVFELTGDTDIGESIDAIVRTDFRDYGSANTKRLETIYIGYVSVDTLAALLRVKDSGHPASYFSMEARDASAPRTSRITPAKGLWGRYWQVELQNVNGGAFTVYDMSAVFATSQRKL